MLRRIILGLGANAVNQAVTIAIQLLSLPLFLLYWDASTYGTWLLLSALPAYLNMADGGIVVTAGNKMTMAMGRSDLADANRIYQSAQLFTTVVCGGLAAVLTPLILFVPLQNFTTLDQRVALVALMASVLVSMFGGLCDAVLKATGRYPVSAMLGPMVRLLEFGGNMLGLFFFRSFAGVAICGLAARTVGLLGAIVVAQSGGHGLRLGFAEGSRSELLSMARPGLSFMAFPLANAVSLQGMTLLVGALAGTAAVALFNVYRRMTRLALQITGMFSLSLWPEFARLFGKSGINGVRSLFERSALLGAATSFLFSFILYFISPVLLRLWTHGRIPFEPGLMAWLLAYAAVGGVWHVPRVFLMSTNQHISLAGWSLAAGVLSVGLGWGLGLIWQINGVGAAMLVSELIIAGICLRLAQLSFAECYPKPGMPPQ